MKFRYLNDDRKGLNEEMTSSNGALVGLNAIATPIKVSAYVGEGGSERRISCVEGKFISKNGGVYISGFGVEVPPACKDWDTYVKGDCHKHCQKSCPSNENWPAW